MPNAKLILANERLLREMPLREPALEQPRRHEALPQFLISSMYAPPAVTPADYFPLENSSGS